MPDRQVLRASALLGVVVVLSGCGALPPVRTDTGPSQDQREHIVSMIKAGQLTDRDEYDRLVLPHPLDSASAGGTVDVTDVPFTVFFTTWTGLSPDPYCGYEYAPTGSPDPDPGGSGQGNELVQVSEAWYWLCAS